MATTDLGDRTGRAMAAQLRAMGTQQVEVGLLHGPTNRMTSRVWTPEEVQAALSWLRRENMRGCNVYVRPVAWQGATPASAGIVLVDDLTREGMAQLHRDGLGPAVVTETSPRNYQAWVRLSPAPLVPALATQAARELAARYDGDPASADWRHYGRLAGLTNRKPSRVQPDGRYPYVLLHESGGGTAPRAGELLEAAAERLRRLERQTEALQADEARLLARVAGSYDAGRGGASLSPAPQRGAVIGDLAMEYRRHAERLIARYPHADMSRLDYAVLRDLAMRRPDTTRHALDQALRLGSPNVARRKTNARWLTAYVEHTTTAVLLNPEVQRARAAYQREQGGRGRGPPRSGAARPRTWRTSVVGPGGRVWAVSLVCEVSACATLPRGGTASCDTCSRADRQESPPLRRRALMPILAPTTTKRSPGSNTTEARRWVPSRVAPRVVPGSLRRLVRLTGERHVCYTASYHAAPARARP